MVKVVDGARASIAVEKGYDHIPDLGRLAILEGMSSGQKRRDFTGAQRFSTVVKGMEEGGTIRIFVDGQEYEIARIG
jgi:hypothetical protein